ncbi:MAG: bifunctional phosphoglucose/phosphomannose isomerase [Syntrophomonadaceae bacterium]|nr:bifunctional phosphoglucose/phosphomannose isomerase [Syntrophomonadaceae bacterium]MDD3270757.1 bifunctional phosphoglucose/phosphomannose isomerase [Syntrophomonadaceae bacterium]MDD3898628.1 bifunctional phosphoglucose/phosphomannose isomerase [Syntrophomonadaceae bacterium]MDD4562684.1 bifunctional phosphoglucose/phosphomannose isomerase [Syntrophomonadaceae bacterium]
MSNEMTAEQMMEYLYGLPEQFASSLELDLAFASRYKKDYRNVVVSGMGGSAIGGDILRVYAAKKAMVPVLVVRDYNIPAFVDQYSLFLAVSYSGNTEETLSAYSQAREQGASIICVTTGGKLKAMAKEDGYAVVEIPAGLVPRAATGYLFAPLALLLEELGIVEGVRQELQETVGVLRGMREELHPGVEAGSNQARIIAGKLKNSLPVIWGTAGVSEVAALRWKAQINENAKCPAYYSVFPELNHNEIVGFEVPQPLLTSLCCIILRDKYDYERVKRRIEISKDIIKERVKEIIEINSQGESYLARFYSLVYIGDYASVYLALEYGINPTPVKVIDYLKAELA